MTREDAIAFFKDMNECTYGNLEAVEMAIEALEQQDKVLEQQDKVLDAIKEIRDLFKQPAAYVPNYDAYGLCLSIICKHMEVE